jgi:hypothetical protein
MADTKISGLPASTVPLAGTEVLPIVQGTTTKQVSIANVTAGRAVAALNLSTSGSTSTTPVLSFNASNCNLASGATVANTYLQAVMQNKSGTAGASTNWAVSNDLGTDSTYYGEMGMNSSVFSASTPADYFSINNGIYFSGHDGDVSIGSGNGYKTYLAWGSTGQSAHVINATGALGFSTNLGTTPALSGTTGFGSSGHVLVSAGSAAAPAWSGSLTGLTTITTSNDATISGLTIGKGLGAVATNTAVGVTALNANTSGSNNVAIGNSALASSQTGVQNTAIGSVAMFNATGSENVAVGYNALNGLTSGASNTGVGNSSILRTTTASNNTGFGYHAVRFFTGGSNTGVGYKTLNGVDGSSTGTNNTGLGTQAGAAITSGTQNTLIGNTAGFSGTNNLTTGSNNIIIGYNAAASSATVSNEVTIGNSSVTTNRLQGNVLIATDTAVTSNGTNLNIYGASASNLSLQNATSGTGNGNGFQLILDGSDTYIQNRENGAILFATNNVQRMSISAAGNTTVTGSILSNGATGAIGYATGSGGAVTQTTTRTTGVTLNKTNGAITLVSAAGLATYQSFTVTNSTVATTDTIIVNQKSGADKYIILVTNVAAGSFEITYATTGGLTTEQPVFNFAVIKAVTA